MPLRKLEVISMGIGLEKYCKNYLGLFVLIFFPLRLAKGHIFLTSALNLPEL